jgi:hypothetical protein
VNDDLKPRSARIADSAVKVIGGMLLVVFLAVAGVFAGNGCKTTEAEARGALESHGMTHIELGGAAWFSCEGGEGSREFTAINPNGKRVAGTVCCGIFGKGCTVRW